jgi:predicted DNA-binding WGR domain protein
VGSPPAGAGPPSASAASVGFRRFEFVDGASRKYWEIRSEGAEMTVRYGRLGTKGQTQSKAFESPERCTLEVVKLVREKLKKGYTEIAPSPGPS